MINKKGTVTLWTHMENYIQLEIVRSKNMQIKTYWSSVNPEKERARSQKWCKEHPEEAKKKSQKQRKRNIITMSKLKLNGCAKCGYNKCIDALVFHHTFPPDKKYNIKQDYVSRKDIIDEVNKCILLCCRCHREIHAKERLNK